jgi:glutamate synthase domain-containing protein 1
MKGRKSHTIVRQALQVLKNLAHRGACGCEVNTGDGAGILVQMPDAFLRKVAPADLPPAGEYGAGLVFLPHDPDARTAIQTIVEKIATEEGQRVLGWRDVPTDDCLVGPSAVRVEPLFTQVFIARGSGFTGPDARLRFERKLYVIRKRVEFAVDRLPISTSSACRRTRSSTRACSRPARSRRCSPTWWTRIWSRRWRSCTSGSARTRSRRGPWRTRTGWSRTTARSTR